MSSIDSFTKLCKNFPDAEILKGLVVNHPQKDVITIEFAFGFIYISPQYGKKYRYPYPDPKTDLILQKIKGEIKDGCNIRLVDARLNSDNPKKNCIWCGQKTEQFVFNCDNTTLNKYPAFCCNECKNKYKNYLRLTANLVKLGKLTKTEREWRLWAQPIIETTADRYLLMQTIMDDIKINLNENEKPIFPKISDNFAVYDNDIWYIQTCESCGKRFLGRLKAKYCSDACRKKVSYQKNKKN